VNVEPTLFQKN